MGSRVKSWVLTAALCVGAGASGAAPLDVLLTNDDGFDAPGLAALRAALQGAGHRVTVVAPLRQQSGSGVRLSLGELALEERAPGTWTVDGSPADSAAVGLARVMAAARPDLVVSGANLGQNLGANVVSSGTVGAAVMAVQLGVPAIAVSVGLDLAEAKATPAPFPSTTAAYPLAGLVLLRLIDRLAARADGGPLLPPGIVLNVNVPALPAARLAGVALAPLGAHGGFRLAYQAGAAGKLRSTLLVDAAGATDDGNDTARFAAGYVTLTVLRPDWNATPAASTAIAARLGDTARLLPAQGGAEH